MEYNYSICHNFLKSNFFHFKKFLFILLFGLILYNRYSLNEKIKTFYSPNTYRIAFVFGTRPEAVKLFPLIKELKKYKNFTCISINTGQHKEMIKQILTSLQMENYIDFNLNLMNDNQSLAKLTSKAIFELDKIYTLTNPDAVIVQGDTTTALAAAVSAFYQKIPIFHVEAGLRTNNMHYPFPEEFNRKTIDDISTLFFAPSDWAASNLLKESKNSSNIFITGNTIVDSLQMTLNNTTPSKKIKLLIDKAKSLCIQKDKCKIILLTCHRRENYFGPIYNILAAVQELLKNFNDIVVIFPFHLNPNVKQSIKNALPSIVYDDIYNGKKIKNNNYFHLNRFLMISPLNYIDLIHLELESYFIMSDSGGIQEEAASIGKPILILRENTERPEAIKSGSAFLVGTSFNKIYYHASSLIKNKELYNKMKKARNIYGKGNSRFIISQIIQNYFTKKRINNKISLNYIDILSQYDNAILKSSNSKFSNKNNFYDIVIVLTVWKRNNLERQLLQVKNQSILKDKKVNIIIFQNYNHININNIVDKWKNSEIFPENVDLSFIQSPIETGYFGRFLIPLISSVSSNSYFIICDDDVIWGNRYFENMIRVVDDGFLATRNGRIITKDYKESSEVNIDWRKNNQVCYNEDIEYDFGGQIWAGRVSWLRKAWNHIPLSFQNSEDFWISAVLKSFYNIATKIPKCPCPEEKPIIPDMCAASDKSSRVHEDAKLHKLKITHDIRAKIMKETAIKYNYQLLIFSKPKYVKNIHKKFFPGNSKNPIFNLSEIIWKDISFFQ